MRSGDFWARSCGAGGGIVAQVGQARLAAVRQAFNHLFLPSSHHPHLAPSRARRSREGYCCLCDGGGQGAVAQLNGGYWTALSDRVAVLVPRKNAPSVSCMCGCARMDKFQSRVYGRNGANPHAGAALMIVVSCNVRRRAPRSGIGWKSSAPCGSWYIYMYMYMYIMHAYIYMVGHYSLVYNSL